MNKSNVMNRKMFDTQAKGTQKKCIHLLAIFQWTRIETVREWATEEEKKQFNAILTHWSPVWALNEYYVWRWRCGFAKRVKWKLKVTVFFRLFGVQHLNGNKYGENVQIHEK